jgi:hypothetical protein
MSNDRYYPEHRHLLALTSIRRSRLLPDAAGGYIEVSRGQRVSLLDVVARGEAPAPFTLIDVARALRLPPDSPAIARALEVKEGDRVYPDTVIARRGRRRALAGFEGTVVAIGGGQVVLRAHASSLDLQAGLNGTVVDVRTGRGVVVEGYGAVLQGVWGNGKYAIGTMRAEPSQGIETLHGTGSAFEADMRGAILLTRRSLRPLTLQIALEQGAAGLIAPSMPSALHAAALAAPIAVMLVEGFGEIRLNVAAGQFFEYVEGRQGSLDAVTPAPLEARRPEVLVNVPFDPNDRPGAPNLSVTLRTGMDVRVLRGEGASSIGTISHLPKTPIVMDNGLRVPCAIVTLTTGEQITAPLANIEHVGA